MQLNGTPYVLRRPLRATRRRMSLRRRLVLAAVAIAVMGLWVLLWRTVDSTESVGRGRPLPPPIQAPPRPQTPTASIRTHGPSPPPPSAPSTSLTESPNTTPPSTESTTAPHLQDITVGVKPTNTTDASATRNSNTAAAADAAAAMAAQISTSSVAPEPAPSSLSATNTEAQRDTATRGTGDGGSTGLALGTPPPRRPWYSREGNEAAFNALLRTHEPGEAWRDPNTSAVLAFSKDGAIIHVTSTIIRRQQHTAGGGPGTFRKWDSIYQPSEHYRIPEWSTPADRDVLVHASIFTSLAAFRDHECALTVRNLFDTAVAPHRLYVGISEERKPSDSSCLSHLGVEDLPSGETRRVLYGVDAPASLGVSLRPLTWAGVVAPRRPLDVDAAMTGVPGSAEAGTAAPDGVFLHPGHTAERLSCIAGELETARDQLLLAEDDAQRAASGGSVFRRGRGGPQQQPSRALAGCRVTTRVTDPQLARGPTFGRYITSLFYFDQDYYMVVDSHTRFSVDWDAKLITRVFQLPTPGVLSYYPNGYREKHDQEEFGKKEFMLMCNAQVLPNGMPKLGARWMPVAPHPILQGFAAAGFMFGDAQYVLDTPFDPFLPYMFDGEEVLFSARMWTSGWDLYGPGQSDVFHHYGRPDTPKYFTIIKQNESTRRQLAEKRTLHLLRRAHPWVEELVRRGYVSVDGKATLKPPPLPPPEAPETRLIVSDAVAAATREINVWQGYYGMGSARTLAEYWQHTRLTDDVVKEKDNEGRWLGGLGLCEAAKKETGA